MTDTSPDLDIDENLAFQIREWRVQRAGWWLLALFVAAGLAGVFGGGPLSSAGTAASGGRLRVEYERFIRRGALTRIAVHLDAAPAQAAQGLRLSRRYFDGVRIQQVTPPPRTTQIGPSDVTMTFDVPGQSTIVIDLEPLSAGTHQAVIAAANGSATFTQYAYF